MHIDSYFSLSNSDIERADYVIFGIPYDATQTYKPGSRFAPSAIREASWNLEEFSMYFQFEFEKTKICDIGNVNCDGNFEEISKKIQDVLAGIKGVPIAIGGEHTITSAIAKKFSKTLFLILDAHFDLREEFDGNKYNHACTTRRILETGNDVFIVGVRSGTSEELKFAKDNLNFVFSWDYDLKKIIDVAQSWDKIYISLDMDVFDPAFAPGVSTPEPFGLKPIEILKLLEVVAENSVGLDVVEVVPDSERITQTLAAKLILEYIAARETKINK